MSFRVSAMVAIPGPWPFHLRAASIRDPNTAGRHLKAPDPALTLRSIAVAEARASPGPAEAESGRDHR